MRNSDADIAINTLNKLIAHELEAASASQRRGDRTLYESAAIRYHAYLDARDKIWEALADAMAVRDAITAEHPFEPKDQPASADGPDMSDVRGLFGELQDDLAEATYIDLLNHRGDMGDLQFYIGRMDAFSTALACCRQWLLKSSKRPQDAGREDKA